MKTTTSRVMKLNHLNEFRPQLNKKQGETLMNKRRIIDGKHKGKYRASPKYFWNLCSKEITRLFSEIIYDENLLNECYCPVRSRDFDDELIIEITTGIPNILICSTKDFPNPDEFLSEELFSLDYQQPFLLVGDVGTGKTTYIHHYFKVKIKKYNFKHKIFGIVINLKDLGNFENVSFEIIEEFVHKKIHEDLCSQYSNISSPDIDLAKKLFYQELIPYNNLIQFKKEKNNFEEYFFAKIFELISNTKLFNKARIRYLQNEGIKISIVIDNVDHFDKNTQEKFFSLSVNLMTELKVQTIMSARDYTLPFAFRHVPVSAFDYRFLHLALPDTKIMLQKRIDYLLKSDFIGKIFQYARKNQIDIYTPSGKHYILQRSDLQNEFETILNSLINSDEIICILEKLSDHDIRAMLKMIRIALSSGYLFTEDRKNRNKLDERDFLRAIMCGNNQHYMPGDISTTSVINIFDNEEPNYQGNNFIRLRSLQSIKVFGEKVDITEIYKFMESIGYNKEKVEKVLQLFINWDLIESPFYEGQDIVNDNIQTLKLTYAGEYYLEELIYNEVYIDEIKYATYMDKNYRQNIINNLKRAREPTLNDKRRKFLKDTTTKSFLKYMGKEENKEKQRIDLHNSESLQNYKKVCGIIAEINEKFNDVLSAPI